MSEPNWVVTLLLSLVLSIPIGIMSNLLTPRIKNWFAKRATSIRGKRIEELRKEYELAKQLHDKPELLNQIVAREIIESIIKLAAGSLFFFLVYARLIVGSSQLFVDSKGNITPSTIAGDLSFLLFIAIVFISITYVTNSLSGLSRTLSRVIDFEAYEKAVLAQIKELEGRHTSTIGRRKQTRN